MDRIQRGISYYTTFKTKLKDYADRLVAKATGERKKKLRQYYDRKDEKIQLKIDELS